MSEPQPTTCFTSASLSVQTTDQENTLPPPWLAEALLIAQLWRASGLVEHLQQQVRLERGRMGSYLVCDFVLVLLAYALSGEPTLQTFFAHLQPVAAVLMAAWNRKQAPHRSTLSRFLAELRPKTVEQLRSLFLSDLNAQGFAAEKCGGLFDRDGQRWLLFDIDGTRACVRQRAIPTAGDYPAGRRRRPACAPGYTGRKRGELVRTRTAVLQAHTGEWLGGLAAAGNGSTLADIVQAGQDIGVYLKARGLAFHQGIVRLDGLYGTAGQMKAVAATGLGVLVRGKDYRLLKLPWVVRCLAAGPTGCWRDPDTGVEREVFDVGVLKDWPAAETEATTPTTAFRLVVTARAVDAGQDIAIGKLKDGRVFELFITSLPQQGFTGLVPLGQRDLDVLNLYLARGLLENSLRHEDREQQIDRWVGIQDHGQSFWQLLALWVSNQRLWLGSQAEPDSERTTLWSQPVAPVQAYSQKVQSVESSDFPVSAQVEPVCAGPQTATPPTSIEEAATPSVDCPEGVSTPEAEKPQPTKAKLLRLQSRPRGPFTHKDFRVSADSRVFCPAGHPRCPNGGQPMTRRNRIRLGHGHERWIFAARYDECLRCPLALECIGEALPKVSCRQVAYRRCPQSGQLLQEGDPRLEPFPTVPPAPVVLLPVPPPKVASGGTSALLWKDISSSRLRREWSGRLRTQRIEVEELASNHKPAPVLIDRHRRAHRRLSWAQCQKRNQNQGKQMHWTVQLHGVPAGISDYLKSLEQRVSAAAA